ncbi:MAG: transporter, partial [Methyloceanibacter sp.]
WAIMPRVAATYFNPKTGWQLNGSQSTCSISRTKRPTPGEILNLEGNITKNLGRWGVGLSAYAMIQTTPDTGAGARLGAFESRVNGIGPLVTYTLGDPKDPLTFIAKYYKEFDAENTFEGESFDIAVTAKF